MNELFVDVDNDKHAPEIDPISSHSRIAQFYRYRPPYTDRFFQVAAEKLSLSQDSTLLDLCCGRGELASKFCDFSKMVFAVDGSSEMLKNKIEKENVVFLQNDVNQEELKLPVEVDHVVIGSAIHWVKQAALKKLIAANLRKNGKFFVSHTLLRFDDEAYQLQLQRINEKFGRMDIMKVDLFGRDKMGACGYEQSNVIRVVLPVKFGIEYLFHNQLSYAYDDFYHKAMSNLNQYKMEFTSALAPFSKHGQLSGKLVNWGVIYSPVVTGQ